MTVYICWLTQVWEKSAVQACGSRDNVCVAAHKQLLLFQDYDKALFTVGLGE